MRVSSMGPYANFNNNQQKLLSDLLKVNDQISSSKKIQYGYQDTETYLDFLKYDHEAKALDQVSDTSQKAENFSKNTDVALTSMKKTLESFKVKLLDAANGSHSRTSLMAVAKDLESLRDHILESTNASVGGKYLFSGTNLTTKPFSEDGKYHGNSDKINALIGNGVQVAYNTDGQELAYGYSSDYEKKITTNVQKFNMTKLHHKVLDEDDPNGVDMEVPITGSDTIRDLVGQPDDTESTYFYIRGRKPDGSGVKVKFEMNNQGTVNDLMEKIGREMGNTELFKAVDVSLNNAGQFEITDIKSGRIMTDFNIVGSNIDTNNIDETTEANDAHIYSFMESGFSYARDTATIGVEKNFYDVRRFEFNTILRRFDTEGIATKYDTVESLFPKDVTDLTIEINGTDYDYTINKGVLVEEMLTVIKSDIKTATGIDMDIEIQSGSIGVFDTSESGALTSLSVTAKDVSGNSVDAFNGSDALGYDKARFDKTGALLVSNVSQVDRTTNTFATGSTQLLNASSMESLDEQTILMDFNDVNGDKKIVELTLRDNPDANGHLSSFKIVEPAGDTNVYDIYDEFGKKTTAAEYTYTELRTNGPELVRHERTAEGVTYKQLMNVVQIAVSGQMPSDNSFTSYQSAVDASAMYADVSLDELGQITIKDYTTSESAIQFSMYDKDSDRFDEYNKVMTKTLKETFVGLKDEQGWDLVDDTPDKTLDRTFGFPFLGDLTISGTDTQGNAVSATVSNTATLQDLMDAIDNTFGDGVGVSGFITDIEDGKLLVRDNLASDTTLVDINFSFEQASIDMQIEKSPPLTFSANNALTIDQGYISLFESLDLAIASVQAQSIRADADSNDPRSIGVQNSIKVVDHILDHLNRTHTQNGSTGNTLEMSYEKAQLMELNTKELSSMVIDTDVGEAMLIMNQRSLAYQSLLATISKISQLNLVNYI